MKYGYLPGLMWCVFAQGFKKHLYMVSDKNVNDLMRSAHRKYKKILSDVQEFDKDDRFIFNILSAAMLAAVYLSLDKKTEVESLTEYYAESMDNFIMRLFLKKSNRYTEDYQKALQKGTQKSKSRNNLYSWVYDFEWGDDINSFTAAFHICGICYLLNSLGIGEITPAMCRYDYTMAEKAGTEFTRQYTLALGGRYCDCHYNNRRAE